MTLVRANPPGWALFELLTSAQMNIIDSQMPRAVDGQDGGFYNLQDPIIFFGAAVPANIAVFEVHDSPNAAAMYVSSDNSGGILIENDAGIGLDIVTGGNDYSARIVGPTLNTASPVQDVVSIEGSTNNGGDNSPALYLLGGGASGNAGPVLEIDGFSATAFSEAIVKVVGHVGTNTSPQNGMEIIGGGSSAAGATGGFGLVVRGGPTTDATAIGGTAVDVYGGTGLNGGDGMIISAGTGILSGGSGLAVLGGDSDGNAGLGIIAYGGQSSVDGSGGPGIRGIGGDGSGTGDGGHGLRGRGGGRGGGSGLPGAALSIDQDDISAAILFESDQAVPGFGDIRPRALHWNNGLKASLNLTGGALQYGSIMPFAKTSGYSNGAGAVILNNNWNIISASAVGGLIQFNFDGTAHVSDYIVLVQYTDASLFGGSSPGAVVRQALVTTRTNLLFNLQFYDVATGTPLSANTNSLGFEILVYERL